MSVSTKSNTVIIGTVYPKVEQYLSRYLDSLEAQSSNSFDLLLANDGFIGLEDLLSKRKLYWHILEASKTVSETRRKLINKAIEYGYSKIIFSDCDDELSFNRVDILSSLLDKYVVVVNDLDIINSSNQLIEKNYLSNRFIDGESINLTKLQSGNMMGLTNTAATASAFNGCIALQRGEALAFDWYLWSTVLLNIKDVIFTNKTTTKYRTYSNNVAGLPQAINKINVFNGLKVKHDYYKLMSEIKDSYSEIKDSYNHQVNQLQCDRNKLSDENIAKYISALQKKKINHPIWWEQIKLLTEVNIL